MTWQIQVRNIMYSYFLLASVKPVAHVPPSALEQSTVLESDSLISVDSPIRQETLQ